jgi:hypothetical protein
MEKHKMMNIIGIAIDDTIANQIPIEYILQEYLSGAFDDVPEINNLMAQEEPLEDISDRESETNSEDGQYKNIPILPIKGKHSINSLPITKNVDEEDSSEHENEKNYENENEKNYENENEKNYENENENEKNYEKNYENENEKSTEILKKSSQIEDESDEDYSEDEVSGDEVSGDEDAPKDKKTRSLF